MKEVALNKVKWSRSWPCTNRTYMACVEERWMTYQESKQDQPEEEGRVKALGNLRCVFCTVKGYGQFPIVLGTVGQTVTKLSARNDVNFLLK